MGRQLVLLDSGPLVGLYNKNDNWHERCKTFFGSEERFDYVLTQAVIAEVIYHIQRGKNAEAAAKAVSNFLQGVENHVFKVHEFHNPYYLSRIRHLHGIYRDKKLDFADLSLIVAAEELKIAQIVTVDVRDFSFLKFETKRQTVRVQRSFYPIIPGA